MNELLVETLIEAAVAAIQTQTAALASSDAGTLRRIVLELEIASNGQVVDSTCWVERRGVHRARKGA